MLIQSERTQWHAAGRKSCAITTARRLGQFLGDERIKDKGLNCNYVVARCPEVCINLSTQSQLCNQTGACRLTAFIFGL